MLGYRSDGGYAEIVKVPVQNLIAIPDSIGFVEAAAFPLAFLTAWHMLITRAKLRAGEDVLVLGAGSGVGQAAIQIAWRHGARVFATAGTDEKLAKARQLGAYEVDQPHHRGSAREGCASSPTAAASTWWSSTSAPRRGIAASRAWCAAGGS